MTNPEYFPEKEAFYKFIISFGIVALATILQLTIWPFISPTYYIFYYPAVIFSCIYGNGKIAILMSVFATQFFFVEPYYSFNLAWPNDYIRIVVFAFSGFAINEIVKRIVNLRSEAEISLKNLTEEKELREKFVYTLTHDLQTPLQAILLTAEMIQKGIDDPAKLKLTHRLLDNVSRIDRMIRDLLDSTRIRAGKPLPVHFEDMDMTDCIQKIITNLNSIYGERFRLLAPSSVRGYWSSDAIQRIVENLCINAVKYGDDKTPITVTITPIQEVMIELAVNNKGKVISPEELKTLFKPFERLHDKERKGWGIGLTLVKGLCQAHGAKLQVNSNNEDGTTFTITFWRDSRRAIIQDYE